MPVRGFTVFVVLCVLLISVNVYLASTFNNRISFVTGRPLSLNDASLSSYEYHRGEKAVPVSSSQCRQTLSLFQKDLLEVAIQQNIRFHRHGGNLRSVQTFKDEAIDRTLAKQGIKFIPENGDTPTGTHKVTEYLKEYYSSHYDPRGGYGKPLPGRYQSSSATNNALLLENRYVNVLEPSEGRLKWDVSLGPIGPTCTSVVQFGEKEQGDGYKFMCMPSNSEEAEAEAEPEKECHVISAGGNDNWKFETALTDKLPHCTTHTFDCTLPDGGQPKRKPNRANVRFYDYCLAGTSYNETSSGRKYLSYMDMLQVAGIDGKTPPAYFKIDVEGFEYDIFTSMIASAENQHLLPSQIQVELHWATRMTGLSWMPRTRSSGELALFSGMMFNGGGYLPVHVDFNPYCNPCMEVLYVKGVC